MCTIITPKLTNESEVFAFICVWISQTDFTVPRVLQRVEDIIHACHTKMTQVGFGLFI